MKGQRDTWRETRLWEELQRRDTEPALAVRYLLEDVLPPVEVVLNKGGTTYLQMTLHEAEHSWRVAEWMAEIAGKEVLAALGAYELAMLLLSAYLHDIGMTPEAGKVEDFLDFLGDGNPRSLSEIEIEEMQTWLDESWDGLVPPLDNDVPGSLALEIVGGYVRHRHNDWSGPWIREYLANNSERLYEGWVEDLVRLCQSHHAGVGELKGADFDPKRANDTPESILHLRYCACLLRLGDILDFDPERTPAILIKHRNVRGESEVHWRKSLGAKIVRRRNQLQLEARPVDAVAHRSILQTVADIEDELALCQQLDDETNFQHLPGIGELPHRWSLDLGVKAKIEPRGDAYQYVDGSFRPDVPKLLKLLGGLALYGDPLVAVREVLQNAFDAVRVQIARERLQGSDPSDGATAAQLASTHSVSLVLEPSESGARLVCRDSGIGMSKKAITDRFLVGGKTSSHDLLRLERASKERGFALGRTARFGIGVLSYFMLAKRMVLRTRPADEDEAPNEPGWTFTSLGLTDFGELRKTPVEEKGTEVVLEIKPEELGGDPTEFARAVARYVAENVKRAPCRFTFSAADFGVAELSFGPGWQDEEESARNALLSEFSSAEDSDHEEKEGSLSRTMRERLGLIIDEGEFPDGLGKYRIFLGHFRLDPGQSIAYLDLKPLGRDRHRIEMIGDGDGWVLPSNLRFSWNGMSIAAERDWEIDENSQLSNPDRHAINAYIQVDWTSNEAGRLAVARNHFAPSVAAVEAMGHVYDRANALWSEFAAANRDSALALLNSHLIKEFPADLKIPPFWAQALLVEGDLQSVLAPLELPAVCIGDLPETHYRPLFEWRGETVASAIGLNIADQYESKRQHRTWFADLFGPQYVGAIASDDWLQPVLVWDRFEPNDLPSGDAFHHPPKFARFPPEWKALASLICSGADWFLNAWNRENPLGGAVDSLAWEWAIETFPESIDPLPHREEVLRTPARAAAWILLSLYRAGEDCWNDLATREPGFVDDAWGLFNRLGEDEEIFAATLHGSSVRVQVLTRRRWWVEEDGECSALKQKLGVPGAEWLVEVVGPAPGD